MPTGRVNCVTFTRTTVLVLIVYFTFATSKIHHAPRLPRKAEILTTNQTDCQTSDGWLKCTGSKLPSNTNETRVEWSVTGRFSINSQDFKYSNYLNELILTGNSLASIESHTFSKMENLVNLTVTSTKISAITRPTLRGLDSLERLDLSNNLFSKLDDVIRGLTELANLRYLSLANNQIANVTEEVVDVMATLSEVDLTDNPLQCDCELKPLRPYILDYRNYSKKTILFVKTGLCGDPVEERNVTVADFMINTFQTHCSPVSEFMFSIYFLIAVLLCAGFLSAIKLVVKKSRV